eukprot:10120185-Alexandrium_andersonii.AAC.1
MLGPQAPPRTAAWETDRSPSRVGPAVWTKAAPNSLRKHVGICNGRRSRGYSGATFLAIQTRMSRERPSTRSTSA